MTPGNRHRRARRHNNISLRDLENLTKQNGLRMSRSTISKMERDKYHPNTHEIQMLCRLLNMSADWWFLGDGQSAYAIGKQAAALPVAARKLIMQTIDTIKLLIQTESE